MQHHHNQQQQHHHHHIGRKEGDGSSSYYLSMPQVSWRETTAYGPFGSMNDGTAKRLHDKLHHAHIAATAVPLAKQETATSEMTQRYHMGYVSVHQLTAQLREIHKWIVSHGGMLDVSAFERIEYNRAQNNGVVDDSYFDDKTRDLIKLALKLPTKAEASLPSSLQLPTIYVDDAHVQPWVYDEINNAFLNSVCRLDGQ